ncbi:unnamed protein product, partial [Brenthis ino]
MSIHPVHVNVKSTNNTENSNAEVNGIAIIGIKTNPKNLEDQAREKGNDLNVNKWIFTKIAYLEYIFSLASKAAVVRDCYSDSDNKFQIFIKIMFPWFFKLNFQYSLVAGICLVVYKTPSAIMWSFSHIFIICISFYLTSILEQINKKILSCEGKIFDTKYVMREVNLRENLIFLAMLKFLGYCNGFAAQRD